MKRLNWKSVRHGTVICAVVVCATALARIETVEFYDSHDNRLFYVTYDYNAQGTLVSRSLYDLTGYFMRKITTERDPSGRITREDYRNFDDEKVTYTKYEYEQSKTTINIFDNYTQDRWTPAVAWYYPVAGTEGAYDFHNAGGAKTNRLQYHRDAQGNPTKIEVFDGAGNMTHYALVTDAEVGTSPVSPAVRSRVGGIRALAGGAVSIGFSIVEKQEVAVSLYDVRGRSGVTLLRREFEAGNHTVKLQTNHRSTALPAGVYVVSVSLEKEATETSRMIQLLR